MGALTYLLSTIMDLCFAVQKLKIFSSNTGKEYFEVLVHLLRYIRDHKNLELKYYSKIEDATISDIFETGEH